MRYAVIIGQRADKSVATISEVGDRRALKLKFDELAKGESDFAELQLCTLSRVRRHRFKAASAPQGDSPETDEQDDEEDGEQESDDEAEGSQAGTEAKTAVGQRRRKTRGGDPLIP